MKLFYRSYGQGEPMLILHGLFEMSDTWVGFAKHWAQKYHVILPDLRNHGFSPHAPEHNSQVMADDIMELTQELKLNGIILIGYSMGGRAAMNFTQRFPYIVKKLIVIDMAPDSYGPDDFLGQHTYLMKMTNVLDINPLLYNTREEILQEVQKIIDNPRLTGLIMKNLKARAGRYEWKFNAPVLKKYINNLRDYPIDLDKAVHTPSLFVRAEQSPYIREKQIELIKRVFTDHRLVTIPGTTHFLQVERPGELMRTVDEFVG